MHSERIHWIDVCRGIAILLVIYGHALSGETFRYVIYAFHIPLFFYLSGIVHHYKKSESFRHMLQKSVKRNLYPYFLFAILTYIAALTYDPNITLQKILYQLFGILYGSGNYNFLGYNVALWFLPCLFVTKIGFFLVEKISNTPKFIAVSLGLLSLVGYGFATLFPDLHLPFGIEIALTGIVFFGLGYLTELRREELGKAIRKFAFPLLICTLTIVYFVATWNREMADHQVDLRVNILGNYFLFYIGAVSGILGTLALSLVINKNRLLEYLGRNSLILYVWHTILFQIFSKTLKAHMSKEEIDTIKDTYLAPAYTGTAIGIILILNKLKRGLKRDFTR